MSADFLLLLHCAMTFFPHNVMRFPDLSRSTSAAGLSRPALSSRIELEYLSDEDLNDIGLDWPMRDFETVKPFWMP